MPLVISSLCAGSPCPLNVTHSLTPAMPCPCHAMPGGACSAGQEHTYPGAGRAAGGGPARAGRQGGGGCLLLTGQQGGFMRDALSAQCPFAWGRVHSLTALSALRFVLSAKLCMAPPHTRTRCCPGRPPPGTAPTASSSRAAGATWTPLTTSWARWSTAMCTSTKFGEGAGCWLGFWPGPSRAFQSGLQSALRCSPARMAVRACSRARHSSRLPPLPPSAAGCSTLWTAPCCAGRQSTTDTTSCLPAARPSRRSRRRRQPRELRPGRPPSPATRRQPRRRRRQPRRPKRASAPAAWRPLGSVRGTPQRTARARSRGRQRWALPQRPEVRRPRGRAAQLVVRRREGARAL